MNYSNARGEYAGYAADPCDGNHLWRAVVLDGRPIGVTCEGPCGTSIPLATSSEETTPILAVGPNSPVRMDFGRGPVTMIVEHIQYDQTGTRVELVDQMSRLERNMVDVRDQMMLARQEIEDEKAKLNLEVEEMVNKRLAEDELKQQANHPPVDMSRVRMPKNSNPAGPGRFA